MAKPITREMIEAMTLDQRKTLKANALSRDTQAAKDLVELLSQDDLMTKATLVPPDAVVPPKPKKMRPVAKPEPVAEEEDEETESAD